MAVRRFLTTGVVLLVAGAVVLALADTTTAFYSIGRSEDEERARRR